MTHPSKARPYVSAIVATTLDGRLRTAGGADYPSPVDQRWLAEGRARADVVLVGGGILREENPRLEVPPALAARRVRLGKPPQPARCIVTHTADFALDCHALQPGAERLVVTSARIDPVRRVALEEIGAEVLEIGEQSVSLPDLLGVLESRGVRRVQCEAGGGLLHPLLAADLVDELLLTLCPVMAGGDFPTAADGPAFPADMLPRFSLIESRRVEDEVFLSYRRR